MVGTVAVLATCLILAILSVTDTLAYTQGTSIEQLEYLTSAHIWTALFVGCVVLGIVAFRRRELMMDAMSASAAVVGAWALVNWLWGLTASSPVSLAGPALATGLSAIAWALARSWVVTERGRGG